MKHSTHSVTPYILFTTVGFLYHITSIHAPNGAVGTDEFLRLSVGRLWRHEFVQQQVELQIHSNEILAVSQEDVPLNCLNKPAQEECLDMVTASLCYWIELLVETQVKWSLNWNYNNLEVLCREFTDLYFIGMCVGARHRYVVTWCSAYSYLLCTRPKFPKQRKLQWKLHWQLRMT